MVCLNFGGIPGEVKGAKFETRDSRAVVGGKRAVIVVRSNVCYVMYVVCVIRAGQIGASLPFFARSPSPGACSVHGCFVGVGRGTCPPPLPPLPLQLARFLMIREEKWTGKLRKKREDGNLEQIAGKVHHRAREVYIFSQFIVCPLLLSPSIPYVRN